MSIKRLIVSLCIIFICTMMFLGGYCKTATIYSYADNVPSGYTQVNDRQKLTDAFLAYCKSRDSNLTSSVLGGASTFSYSVIQNATKAIGVSIDDLQAQLWYLNSNTGLKWFFTASGVNIFNQIFAYLIQENNLQVGQPANKEVYNGLTFTDADGNKCLVYVLKNTHYVPLTYTEYFSNYVQYTGTSLKYTPAQIASNNSLTYNLTSNQSYTIPVYHYTGSYNQFSNLNLYSEISPISNEALTEGSFYGGFDEVLYNGVTKNYLRNGYYTVVMNNADASKLYFSKIIYYNNDINGEPINYFQIYTVAEITNVSNNDKQNITVNFTSNNIKNEYHGDTNITNEGDTINNYPDNDYDPYPDGGGGTTPPSNTGGGSGEDDGTITFPDFDFHLPEINWSLGDLSEKFPFSIPFDLIAFFTVLNAEPQAPAIDADIPLGSWYTWHFEADFAQFDNYAVIIRNVEFIGFCVGLIYLTIKLVKG